MDGEPKAGVMRVLRARKEVMSNSWSCWISIDVDTEEQSALLMPLAIVTIEVQR